MPSGADDGPDLDALLVRGSDNPGGRVSWWGGNKPKKTTGPPKKAGPPPPKKPPKNKPLGNGR